MLLSCQGCYRRWVWLTSSLPLPCRCFLLLVASCLYRVWVVGCRGQLLCARMRVFPVSPVFIVLQSCALTRHLLSFSLLWRQTVLKHAFAFSHVVVMGFCFVLFVPCRAGHVHPCVDSGLQVGDP
jgi:hypothetical protein